MALPDFKGYKVGARNDKKLMEWLWPILDEADVVVAHNGDKFDVKKINYRFMIHGMNPPSPYKTVDTLKAVKGVSSWDSHRLNELCRQLGLGQKHRTGGADLWFDCLAGSDIAWRKMKRYNAKDVKLLEELYLLVRPWIKNHPNHGTYTGIASCPKCGSVQFQSRGKARTASRTYNRFQCGSCGGWFRDNHCLPEGKASVVIARG
jgi:DNA polymerase III epsilon subunit-like protein